MNFGRLSKNIAIAALLILTPLVISYFALGLDHSHLSVPFYYGHGDDIWQFTLTKVLKDTGWILWNPYLGAPETASWHHNSAAQTSALHSLLMLSMSPFFDSAISLQQTYYVLNFPLICVTTYICSRQLGINRTPALCASFLFAFCTYRFYFLIYSFLPNYFTVPLGLLITLWVLQGKFHLPIATAQTPSRLGKYLSKPRHFLVCIGLTALIGISDGYYAFFTLLLLGFAAVVRCVGGDWRTPKQLLPVFILIAVLISSSLAIQAPLYLYKQTHNSEFYLDGVIDPVLVKQPFEAEVYSTSLKLLISPIPQNHIEALAKAGQYAYKSSSAARRFEAAPAVVLGTVGSILFVIALFILVIPNIRRRIESNHGRTVLGVQSPPLIEPLLAVILFVFLTSTSGGLGTIIALIFPTIRAYDRFAIFLDLSLLLLGAHLASCHLNAAPSRAKVVSTLIMVGITAFGVYDQIPNNSDFRPPEVAPTFNSEKDFVSSLESIIPKDSMVYQYPYSNYLRNSKYYGWGSFSHVRLYLFSKTIHWSNGGAKNSPADDWNYRISQLPFEEQIAEISALNFKAIVIDRTVVKDDEYNKLVNILQTQGMHVVDDRDANLSYALLIPSGIRIKYEKDYKSLQSIVVERSLDLRITTMPSLINRSHFIKYLAADHDYPLTIMRPSIADVSISSELLTKGNGDSAIKPIESIRAGLACKKVGKSEVQLTLSNDGPFNLSLAQGSFPINIGVHVINENGTAVLWDNGARISPSMLIKTGEIGSVLFDTLAFPDIAKALQTPGNYLKFELVQDANSWLAGVSCKVVI